MQTTKVVSGFSKLTKEQKLELITRGAPDQQAAIEHIKSFWHQNPQTQKLFDEFSENTVTNYFFPYGIAPNMVINGKMYLVPMVIEESSVIAAAANSAKFWASRGGFRSEIIATVKLGQVHFIWNGNYRELKKHFARLKQRLLNRSAAITANMEARGGGVLEMEIINKTRDLEDYYQLMVKFDTRDSMGANFINSCLEEYAAGLREFVTEEFPDTELNIIMSILSNYTPDCLVRTWVECDVNEFACMDPNLSAEEFTWKFEKAVQIATVDTYRATTHNKGIFNGVDAVVLATGNDFRAVEACGHTYAAREGGYKSLTKVEVNGSHFKYQLDLPLALGTVGGLTSLHPMARFSLELLGNPNAEELMMIASATGLANNFGAVKSLVTKGIQIGHMKMHLYNILNTFQATEEEKKAAVEFFKDHKVSFNAVDAFITRYRKGFVNN